MSHEAYEVIRRVLEEAIELPSFFDLSDAERVNWMIFRGYELGKLLNPGQKNKADSEASACSPTRGTFQ